MLWLRLKNDEGRCLQLEWDAKRELSKANYRIHTDAIKAYLIPENLTPAQINFTYASEADMLNVALFGKTAKQWRDENPDIQGNIREKKSAGGACTIITKVAKLDFETRRNTICKSH